MTWEEFHELFMGKFFLASVRHAKAREFLELKQGTMSVLEYVAKFTELAHFIDAYVSIDMAKVRKFEDGLKLSIRGKILGFLLQDLDSMVKTTMDFEREVKDTRNIWDAGVKDKRRESQPSSSRSGKKIGFLLCKGFKDKVMAIMAKVKVDHPKVGDISGCLANRCRGHVSIATSLVT